MDKVNVSLGGFSISDEMCVNYVHYFPRIDLEVCKSSVSWEALRNYFKFENELVLFAFLLVFTFSKYVFFLLDGTINPLVQPMESLTTTIPLSGLN